MTKYVPWAVAAVLLTGGGMHTVGAADSDYVGNWMLTVNQGRSELNGVLTIEAHDDGLKAWVEGGPARLLIDGNRIEMAADDRTSAGEPYERYYEGTISGDDMSGTFGPENPITEHQAEVCERIPLGCPFPTGTWTAQRMVAEPQTSSDPQPVDLTGKWGLASGGLRKWSMDLTAAGQEWLDTYDAIMDLPRQRCVSSGLVMTFGGRGSVPEIYVTEDKITFVRGSDVRRIYMDGRQAPEFHEHSALGFSSGRWEGSTLVVETTHLLPAVRDFNGELVGENARVVERYSLNEDGTLTAVMTLHDPDHYQRPPVVRARWRRVEDMGISTPVRCDPDSFYRQLHDDGKMQEYFDRWQRRF